MVLNVLLCVRCLNVSSKTSHLTSSAITYKHIQWGENWHKKLPPSTRCALYHCKHKAPLTLLSLVRSVRGLCFVPGRAVAGMVVKMAVSGWQSPYHLWLCQQSLVSPALELRQVCLTPLSLCRSLREGGRGGWGRVNIQTGLVFLTPNHCASQPALTVSRHTKTHRRLLFLGCTLKKFSRRHLCNRVYVGIIWFNASWDLAWFISIKSI